MKKPRVLFVSQEMIPYHEESEIANIARYLPQGIQQKGKEIRAFMPKFGSINERRNQLHEVIRLSGMNLIIDDSDHPLIIKVASIQPARMQVYFIDNDEYFGRKYALKDKANKFYADNDERAIFYCRGVLETVKKLGWSPDIIHCHGWMTALIPLYIKKVFNEDPIFENSKVVYSVYNEGFDKTLDKRFIQKAVIDGVNIKNLKTAEKPDFDSINKLAIEWSDGVIKGSEELNKDMDKHINSLKKKKPVLEYFSEEECVEKYDEFYDSILAEELAKK